MTMVLLYVALFILWFFVGLFVIRDDKNFCKDIWGIAFTNPYTALVILLGAIVFWPLSLVLRLIAYLQT